VAYQGGFCKKRTPKKRGRKGRLGGDLSTGMSGKWKLTLAKKKKKEIQ